MSYNGYVTVGVIMLKRNGFLVRFRTESTQDFNVQDYFWKHLYQFLVNKHPMKIRKKGISTINTGLKSSTF